MQKLSAPSDWTSPTNLSNHATKHGPAYNLTPEQYDALATQLLKRLQTLRQLQNKRPRPANKHTDGENVIVTTPEGKIITMYPRSLGQVSAATSQYSRPYPLDKLPEYLRNDPTHRWRAETGIELIHEEPSWEEFDRVSKNWDYMSDEQKALSDAKSMELYGMTNQEHRNFLQQVMLAKKLGGSNPKAYLAKTAAEVRNYVGKVAKVTGRII